jgi:hypothetical protein
VAPGRHLVATLIGRLSRAVPLGAALVASSVLLASSSISGFAQADAPVYLIIRSDDAGMSHSVNMALQAHVTAIHRALKARNVVLTTYRELIAKHGLTAMRRPAG